jgi:hypothetical protein
VQIGDTLSYRGRPHLLVGLDPMSVVGRRAELEDTHTGERISVLFGELQRAASAGQMPAIRPGLAKDLLS